MKRRRLVLLSLGVWPAALAAQGLAIARGHDSNAPIDVSSDHIELQERADRAIFVGNVHVVQGDMTMDAARMTVAYTKPPQPNSDPQIQRIDASGGVIVRSPGQSARGNFGIYDLNRRLITLIGGVTLNRGGNTVNGARAVMDLNSGRSVVDGNAVGGAAGTTTSRGGRVTGRFTVPQHTQAAPAAGAPPAK